MNPSDGKVPADDGPPGGEPNLLDDETIALLAAYDEQLRAGPAAGPATELDGEFPKLPAHLRRTERLLQSLSGLARLSGPITPAGETRPLADRLEGPVALPTKIGRFEIRRELGHGGFGIVFHAYDPTLHREVALKIPRIGALLMPELRSRFLHEARAASALNHPNIVPVYEAGDAGPVCYIATSYCSGPTLAHWLQDHPGPVPIRLVARIVATLADAITHAHRHGVLHRDLKPSNILLEVADTDRAAAHLLAADSMPFVPKVADFGLAKLLDGEPDETRTGVLMGTASYMAPEQAAGGKQQATVAADVYALGAILYELLTGRPPFQGDSPLEILHQVRQVEPVPPKRLRGDIPRDMETICLKSLEKEPLKRYLGADDLAADLRRFLDGEPIRARPVSVSERLARWARRNPMVATLAATASLLMVLVTVVAAVGYLQTSAALSRAEDSSRDADRQREEAVQQRDMARLHLYFAEMHLGHQAWKAGEIGRLQELLDPYYPTPRQADLRGWEWYYLRARCRTLLSLRGHDGSVRSIAWHPSGEQIASGGADSTIRIWDLATRRPRLTLQNPGGDVLSVAWSPDGTRLASSGPQLSIWNTETGQLVRTLTGNHSAIRTVAWHPDGTQLISADSDRIVKIWDVGTGEVVRKLPADGAQVWSVAWSHDGTRVASGGVARTIRIWNPTDDETQVLTGHKGEILGIAWSPDDRYIASASQDLTIRIWDAAAGTLLHTLNGHAGTVWTVMWSSDGRRLASASNDGTIRLWNAERGEEELALRGHMGGLFAVAWSPDDTQLASVGRDEAVRVIDAAISEESTTLAGHTDQVWGVAWHPEGDRLASASDDGTVKIWDSAHASEIRTIRGHSSWVVGVAWSHDGRRLASSSGDRTIKIWDPGSGDEEITLHGHARPVRCVAWSKDDRRIASAGDDRSIRIWDAKTGEEVRRMEGHHSAVPFVAWDASGTRLASAGGEGVVKIWDAATGAEQRVFHGHRAAVSCVAWTDNDATLASAGTDGTIILWDVATGRELRTLRGHTGAVVSLAWTPDGSRLASGSADATIRIWAPSGGQETLTLRTHTSLIQSLAWSPDGRRLASASWDQTVQIFDATLGFGQDP